MQRSSIILFVIILLLIPSVILGADKPPDPLEQLAAAIIALTDIIPQFASFLTGVMTGSAFVSGFSLRW